MKNTTLVVGVSPNPTRYSNIAINRLVAAGEPVLAYGLRAAEVDGVPIETDKNYFLDKDIHTVTLYVGPQRQGDLYNWILSLKPKRVIFNPGTENYIFQQMLREAGVQVIEACTLVMLSMEQYAMA